MIKYRLFAHYINLKLAFKSGYFTFAQVQTLTQSPTKPKTIHKLINAGLVTKYGNGFRLINFKSALDSYFGFRFSIMNCQDKNITEITQAIAESLVLRKVKQQIYASTHLATVKGYVVKRYGMNSIYAHLAAGRVDAIISARSIARELKCSIQSANFLLNSLEKQKQLTLRWEEQPPEVYAQGVKNIVYHAERYALRVKKIVRKSCLNLKRIGANLLLDRLSKYHNYSLPAVG
jgi:hypothetical protein